MKKKRIVIGIIVGIIAVISAWVAFTNLTFKTSHITVKNPKIPKNFKGFKIAQISDYHNRDWSHCLVDKIKEEHPDIIVITGDLVDATHTDIDISMSFVEDLVEIAPVYYVTGNHECFLSSYDELEERLTDAGVNMMKNRAEYIERDGEKLNLIGLWDPDFAEKAHYTGNPGKIVKDNLAETMDGESYNIILCHRPELFKYYVEMDADLVLTGHAHGGQVRVPFVGGLFAPQQGTFPKYDSGMYHENNTDMYVSQGLGNSVVPVRINDSFELVIYELDN